MSKNTNRKIFAATASAALVASAVVPTAALAEGTDIVFSDVDKNHIAAGHVQDLIDAKVVNGYKDGTFKPTAKVTRGEVSKMVASILDLKTDSSHKGFPDVKKDAWFADSINALEVAGFIKGYKNGTFDPNGEMTRAEFAKVVVDAYELPAKSVDLPFDDVEEKDWYSESIQTLYAHGLINGQTATTFAPNESIKRIDLALLLANTDYKFGDKLPKPQEDEVIADLEAKIDEVHELNADNYTTGTWNAVIEERNKAQKIINDKNATQAEIDKALKDLENALDDLVLSEVAQAQEKFLADLETKVGTFAEVAEVKIDNKVIDIKFTSDVNPQDVKNTAQGLVTALKSDVNSGTLSIDEKDFNLTDNQVVTKSANSILKGVTPVSFLKNGTLVSSDYTATISDNKDVEFDLAGTLKFTTTK